MILLLTPPSKYSKNIIRDLLYGCWCSGKRIGGAQSPNLTLLFIATVLEKIDRCKYLDLTNTNYPLNRLFLIFKYFDYIILCSASSTIYEDITYLEHIKKEHPKVKVIIFGPYATFFPKDLLELSVIDYVIIGEAEESIKSLIIHLQNSEDISKISGIGFRKNNEIIINGSSIYISNLDKIPIPNRLYIKDTMYFHPLVEEKKWTTALTSRGCPHHCIFCSSPIFYGHNFRYNSSSRLIEEVIYLISLGYKELFFRDENFVENHQRIIAFCSEILKRNIKFIWICNARVDSVSFNLLKLMQYAGCRVIKFGIESGNQQILNKMNT